jgi:phage-related tail protein
MIDRERLAGVVHAEVHVGLTSKFPVGRACNCYGAADKVLALVGPEVERLTADLQKTIAERNHMYEFLQERRKEIADLREAKAERDRLREQVEAARLGGISARSVIAGQASDIKHLREQAHMLWEALAKYGDHVGCGCRPGNKGMTFLSSDCRIAAALAGTAAP